MDQLSYPSLSRPNYGRRVLVNIIDEVADAAPSRPFVFTPRTSEPKDGWKPVTFKEVSNAVNYVAHNIVEETRDIPVEQDEFPTVAYIGPSDIRYFIFMFACIKAARKAFFISPRNSLEGQLSLLEVTNCTVLYYAETYKTMVQPWLQQRHMRAIMAPASDVWLFAECSHFPYSRTFDQARWDPLVVLHTSGSTGTPKPVVVRQGSFVIADGSHNLPTYHGSPVLWKYWANSSKRIFLPMPLFHAAGISVLLTMTICYETPTALSVPGRPIDADLVMDCLAKAEVDATILAPSMVEEIASTEAGICSLAKMRFIAFGGGNLSRAVGAQLVAKGVTLCNGISSTEYFPYPVYLQPNPALWQYFIIHSEVMGADWRLVPGGEGVYELVVQRKDPNDPGMQAVFYTFPELTEWATGDLFKPHPTLPDHWTYHGRTDNIIVFSNGEKLNPVTIEDIVTGHSAVKGALVAGQDRFQAVLILEPALSPKDDKEAKALIDDVWPLVEEANQKSVAHGRISRQLLALSNKDKPFLRTGKGTVRRRQTLEAYKEYIDSIYDQAEVKTLTQDISRLELGGEDILTKSILEIFKRNLDNGTIHAMGADSDFFAAGVDSIQIITIAGLLRSSLAASGASIDPDRMSPSAIYANPTPRLLARHLLSMIHSSPAEPCKVEIGLETERLREIVSNYTLDLPAPNDNQADPLDEGQTIFLTGTTGSLGAYILDRLCSSRRVAKVIAINRGDDGGRSRQPFISTARGLSTDFSKVDFVGADLSKQGLGLSQDKFHELLHITDRIIHNAWPVNFNISVSSFEPSIRGVRNLVDFANAARKRVPVVFISSIGTVDGWTASSPVPEKRIDDLKLPQTGYGRSKLAGSLILDAAVQHSGITAASIRVGQIAGPKCMHGVWNKHEFIPSLIASSVYLGILPQHLGPQNTVDWLPAEDAAGLIMDITGVTAKTPLPNISGYFHGVNRTTIDWEELAQTIKEHYKGKIKRLVSLEEWVKTLRGTISHEAEFDLNPAIKLLDTYQGMLRAHQDGRGRVTFATKRTTAHSQTMTNLGPVTTELMANWCEQWGF